MNNRNNEHVSAITTVVVLLVLGICFLLIDSFKSRDVFYDDVSLELNGSDLVYLYVGETYTEPGFTANIGNVSDISSYVTVDISSVDTNNPGIYDIIYELNYNGSKVIRMRKVKVLAKSIPVQDVSLEFDEIGDVFIGENDALRVVKNDKIKMKLKGYSHIYLLKGSSYVDEGVFATNSYGDDISNRVVIDGYVDTNKAGSYTLTYSLKDGSNNIVSVKRVVDVLDMDAKAMVNTNDLTNKSVVLKFEVVADNFSYMIMPNGVKNKSSIGEYIIQENGVYFFTVVNQYGHSRRYIYNVSNIDKTMPNGSCSVKVIDEKSIITVSANDNVGISKYMIGDISFTDSSIELSEISQNPNVVIYDKANNTKTIYCQLEK